MRDVITIILHAENICSDSSGNWTAFGNCGKGIFPNWYKVMEKLHNCL